MSINLLLIILLAADAVLCFAIIILIAIVNREVKRRKGGPDEDSLKEFRILLDESQASTNHLLEVMNESRKALKEIAFILDEKESKLRFLVEEARTEYDKLHGSMIPHDRRKADNKYEDVIAMVKQGLPRKEICQRLELTEGEVDLIIDLHGTKPQPKL